MNSYHLTIGMTPPSAVHSANCSRPRSQASIVIPLGTHTHKTPSGFTSRQLYIPAGPTILTDPTTRTTGTAPSSKKTISLYESPDAACILPKWLVLQPAAPSPPPISAYAPSCSIVTPRATSISLRHSRAQDGLSIISSNGIRDAGAEQSGGSFVGRVNVGACVTCFAHRFCWRTQPVFAPIAGQLRDCSALFEQQEIAQLRCLVCQPPTAASSVHPSWVMISGEGRAAGEALRHY